MRNTTQRYTKVTVHHTNRDGALIVHFEDNSDKDKLTAEEAACLVSNPTYVGQEVQTKKDKGNGKGKMRNGVIKEDPVLNEVGDLPGGGDEVFKVFWKDRKTPEDVKRDDLHFIGEDEDEEEVAQSSAPSAPSVRRAQQPAEGERFVHNPSGDYHKHFSGHFHKIKIAIPLGKKRYTHVVVLERNAKGTLNLKDDKGMTFQLPKEALFSNPSYADLEVDLKEPMSKGRTRAKIQGEPIPAEEGSELGYDTDKFTVCLMEKNGTVMKRRQKVTRAQIQWPAPAEDIDDAAEASPNADEGVAAFSQQDFFLSATPTSATGSRGEYSKRPAPPSSKTSGSSEDNMEPPPKRTALPKATATTRKKARKNDSLEAFPTPEAASANAESSGKSVGAKKQPAVPGKTPAVPPVSTAPEASSSMAVQPADAVPLGNSGAPAAAPPQPADTQDTFEHNDEVDKMKVARSLHTPRLDLQRKLDQLDDDAVGQVIEFCGFAESTDSEVEFDIDAFPKDRQEELYALVAKLAEGMHSN